MQKEVRAAMRVPLICKLDKIADLELEITGGCYLADF